MDIPTTNIDFKGRHKKSKCFDIIHMIEYFHVLFDVVISIVILAYICDQVGILIEEFQNNLNQQQVSYIKNLNTACVMQIQQDIYIHSELSLHLKQIAEKSISEIHLGFVPINNDRIVNGDDEKSKQILEEQLNNNNYSKLSITLQLASYIINKDSKIKITGTYLSNKQNNYIEVHQQFNNKKTDCERSSFKYIEIQGILENSQIFQHRQFIDNCSKIFWFSLFCRTIQFDKQLDNTKHICTGTSQEEFQMYFSKLNSTSTSTVVLDSRSLRVIFHRDSQQFIRINQINEIDIFKDDDDDDENIVQNHEIDIKNTFSVMRMIQDYRAQVINVNLNEKQKQKVFKHTRHGKKYIIILNSVGIVDSNQSKRQRIFIYIEVFSEESIHFYQQTLFHMKFDFVTIMYISSIILIIASIVILISIRKKNIFLDVPISNLTQLLGKIPLVDLFKFSFDEEFDTLKLLSSRSYETKIISQSIFQFLSSLNFISFQLHSPDDGKTLIYLCKQIQYFKKYKNNKGVGICCNNIGNIHFNNERYFESLQAYQDAIISCKYELLIYSPDHEKQSIHKYKIQLEQKDNLWNLFNRKFNFLKCFIQYIQQNQLQSDWQYALTYLSELYKLSSTHFSYSLSRQLVLNYYKHIILMNIGYNPQNYNQIASLNKFIISSIFQQTNDHLHRRAQTEKKLAKYFSSSSKLPPDSSLSANKVRQFPILKNKEELDCKNNYIQSRLNESLLRLRISSDNSNLKSGQPQILQLNTSETNLSKEQNDRIDTLADSQKEACGFNTFRTHSNIKNSHPFHFRDSIWQYPWERESHTERSKKKTEISENTQYSALNLKVRIEMDISKYELPADVLCQYAIDMVTDILIRENRLLEAGNLLTKCFESSLVFLPRLKYKLLCKWHTIFQYSNQELEHIQKMIDCFNPNITLKIQFISFCQSNNGLLESNLIARQILDFVTQKPTDQFGFVQYSYPYFEQIIALLPKMFFLKSPNYTQRLFQSLLPQNNIHPVDHNSFFHKFPKFKFNITDLDHKRHQDHEFSRDSLSRLSESTLIKGMSCQNRMDFFVKQSSLTKFQRLWFQRQSIIGLNSVIMTNSPKFTDKHSQLINSCKKKHRTSSYFKRPPSLRSQNSLEDRQTVFSKQNEDQPFKFIKQDEGINGNLINQIFLLGIRKALQGFKGLIDRDTQNTQHKQKQLYLNEKSKDFIIIICDMSEINLKQNLNDLVNILQYSQVLLLVLFLYTQTEQNDINNKYEDIYINNKCIIRFFYRSEKLLQYILNQRDMTYINHPPLILEHY